MPHHHHHHHGGGGFGGFHHHHHHHRPFHHHHNFHHHHRHWHPRGPGPAAWAVGGLAVGALAGAAAGATVATVAARPCPRRPCARPQRYIVDGCIRVPPVVVQVPPEMPLGISRVALPSGLMEKRGNVLFFAVDATSVDGGASWRVMRRYNDFDKLLTQLGISQNFFPGSPFPGKHSLRTLLFGADSYIEERRADLESWLAQCIAHPAAGPSGPWVTPLRSFLEAGRVPISSSSAGPPSPTAPPSSTPAPPHPQMPQQASSAPPPAPSLGGSAPPLVEQPSAAEADMLEVEVPSGVYGGQQMSVTVPDGRQYVIGLPPNAKPGDRYLIQVDPTTGMLTMYSSED